MRAQTLSIPVLLSAACLPAQFDHTVVRQHTGGQFDEYYGESVAWIGDVDRDQVGDYVVGASRYATSNGDVGRVQMISGATGRVLYTILGSSRGERFGFSLARLGDQNGDGVPEFVVGAPFHDGRGTDSGRAICFDGATGRFLWQANGTGSRQYFGWSMTAFAQIGPGSPGGEVAIGAPTDGSSGESRVWIVSGRWGNVLASASAPARHRLGTAVAADHTLLAVGAPGSGPNSEGSVRFFRYSGSLSEFPVYLSFDAGARIGSSIRSCNLPNGANFVLGGPGHASIPGRVDLVRATIVSNARLGSLLGTRAGDGFGHSVAAGRDADGDGVQDVLVGAPFHSLRGPQSGAFHLFSGRTLARSFSRLGGSGESYGWAVHLLGDLTGDGLAEFAVGVPFATVSGVPSAGRLDVSSVDVDARTEAFGIGCSPAALTADPQRLHPGGAIALTTSGLPEGGASGVWILGLDETAVDLTSIGMSGCWLNTTPLVTETLVTTTGLASRSWPLPGDPALSQDVLRSQVVLLAPGANRAGAISTRGLRMILGNR